MTMKIETVARIAHEVNRVYCQTLGDHSQPEWHVAPAWQKASAITGVLHYMEFPNISPQDTHASWLEHKRADGWKYGPVKDPVKKEHPCFLPYDELPVAQQMKDHFFHAVVKAAMTEVE